VSAGFVSVIVVNFNGRRFLSDCLSALERQSLPRHRFEVLLVDNGSTDGSIEFVKQQFPWVRLLPQTENLGFAEANNRAERLARGEWVALLNNDTRVDPLWLEALLSAASDPAVGGVASRVLFRDRPNVINSAGLTLYRDGRGGDRLEGTADSGITREPADVFGGSGSSLLLRRAMLADVGFFDPSLFMYYEDLDLAWRARLRGWRFVYAPAAVVEHVHCGSSGTASPFFLRQVERNRVLVNIRNAPPFLALANAVGLLARAGRLIWRFATARKRYKLGPRYLTAMAAAIGDSLWELPAFLLARYETRTARRRQPDQHVIGFMRRGA
jgi:GT2 family glycosyltransferase